MKDQRLERLITFPLLEEAQTHVERAPELAHALTAGVEQIHAIDSAQTRPEDAAANRDSGVREAATQHTESVVVLFGAGLLLARESGNALRAGEVRKLEVGFTYKEHTEHLAPLYCS